MAAALTARELGSHAKGVSKLSLAAPEFAKRFRDTHALDSSLQQLIELLGARRYLLDFLSLFQDFHASQELIFFDLASCLKDLFCLGVRDALDIEHFLFGAHQT